jgi:beta-lactamase class A
MIRYSDNDATDALWEAVGGDRGLDAANDTLGLSRTTAGRFGAWGLTRTTAADQLLLLKAVFGEDSPLSASSRAYLRTLMGAVTPGQCWGVAAASDPHATAPALKNGWLERTATGLWDINSVGRVRFGGHTLLVAVLSDGQPSERAGVRLVERAATAAVHALVQNTAY